MNLVNLFIAKIDQICCVFFGTPGTSCLKAVLVSPGEYFISCKMKGKGNMGLKWAIQATLSWNRPKAHGTWLSFRYIQPFRKSFLISIRQAQGCFFSPLGQVLLLRELVHLHEKGKSRSRRWGWKEKLHFPRKTSPLIDARKPFQMHLQEEV